MYLDTYTCENMKGIIPLRGKEIDITSVQEDSTRLGELLHRYNVDQCRMQSSLGAFFMKNDGLQSNNQRQNSYLPVQDLTPRYGYELPPPQRLAQRQSQSKLSSRQVESILRGPKLKQSRPLRRR